MHLISTEAKLHQKLNVLKNYKLLK